MFTDAVHAENMAQWWIDINIRKLHWETSYGSNNNKDSINNENNDNANINNADTDIDNIMIMIATTMITIYRILW